MEAVLSLLFCQNGGGPLQRAPQKIVDRAEARGGASGGLHWPRSRHPPKDSLLVVGVEAVRVDVDVIGLHVISVRARDELEQM